MPFWLLVIVQWVLALGVAIPVVGIFSLLWPVACLYYHNVAKTLGNDIQVLLSIMGVIFAVMIYPFVLVATAIIALVMWFVWIIRDIKAIAKSKQRPPLLPEKYQGLYGFVN